MLDYAINNETGGSANFPPVSRHKPIFGGYEIMVENTIPSACQENQATKKCTKCREEKPLSQFSSMAISNDGLAWNCKACAAKSNAQWRAANKEKIKSDKAAYEVKNRERIKARHAAWREANIEHVKARGAEYRALRREEARARAVAWRAANVKRSRSTVKAWRAANPEKVKAILDTWKEKNPHAKRIYNQNREACKRASGKLSRGIIAILFKRQSGRCPCCGEKLGNDYQLDHIMPIALGGANVDSNVQLLRKRCNLQKNKKHPVDFMQERGFLL